MEHLLVKGKACPVETACVLLCGIISTLPRAGVTWEWWWSLLGLLSGCGKAGAVLERCLPRQADWIWRVCRKHEGGKHGISKVGGEC